MQPLLFTRRSWIACTAGAGLHTASSCLAAESKKSKAVNEYKSEQLRPYLQATEWTLYSLHPAPWNIQESRDPFAQPAGASESPADAKKLTAPKEVFHEHAVLGQLQLKENEKLRYVVTALDVFSGKNWQNGVAGCFWPRHGIRIVHESKRHDLLICYECSRTLLFIEDKRVGMIHMNSEPQFQATPYPLDGLLNKAKIPRASRS